KRLLATLIPILADGSSFRGFGEVFDWRQAREIIHELRTETLGHRLFLLMRHEQIQRIRIRRVSFVCRRSRLRNLIAILLVVHRRNVIRVARPKLRWNTLVTTTDRFLHAMLAVSD